MNIVPNVLSLEQSFAKTFQFFHKISSMTNFFSKDLGELIIIFITLIFIYKYVNFKKF